MTNIHNVEAVVTYFFIKVSNQFVWVRYQGGTWIPLFRVFVFRQFIASFGRNVKNPCS